MIKPHDTPNCCQGVDGPCSNTSKWRRQDTAYVDPIKNWVNACDECFEAIEDNWAEAWQDARGGV